LFVSLISIVGNAQTGYYLNPNTGQRDIIFLVITPLGTDAQYRNDYSVKEYKPIDIKGDPIKLKKAKATLPTNEKITIVFPTDKEYAKFIYSNGTVKSFRNAYLYSNKKDNQTAHLAVETYLQNDDVKYKVFYKAWEKNTEQQLEVLETGYTEKSNIYYKVIMPDGSFATLEEYSEENSISYYLRLTDGKGNKVVFTKEE
jgi:hypothetical protein